MKEKLFYQNAYLKQFTGTIVKTGVENNLPYVVLAETAFYPTGGGQPCDWGTIGGIEVVDVEEVDGEIRHRLARMLPEDASAVACEIDWDRRFDHMQQHTGQHILSASFDELFHARTVGFHLGRERVTIDLAVPELTQEMAEQAEALANRVVFENRKIEARVVPPEELAAMPLRKPPTVTENIRVVIISGFDYNPCGGTHPNYTGEVGPIKILDWERHKGNVRLSFLCGRRVLAEMGKKQLILRNLSRQLSSSEEELADRVSRLLEERREFEHALQSAGNKLLEAEARELVANARLIGELRAVTGVFAGRPMQELQRLAQHISALSPSSVSLLAASGEKTQLVFARGADVTVPMNELLKDVLAQIDGKGGGNPSIAQGGGSGSRSGEELIEQALCRLAEKLGLAVR
jgi:alanyl-tRNA synthetase